MQKMKMWIAVIFVCLLLCGCGKSAGNEEVITPESLVQEIVSTETAEETVEQNTQETEETEEEATAINCHMGFADRSTSDLSIGSAYQQYPLAWLLHVADESATYIRESNI